MALRDTCPECDHGEITNAVSYTDDGHVTAFRGCHNCAHVWFESD